jgi:hypothetical protein
MSSRNDWMADGLCRQVDNEPWFPEKGESTIEAKRVCLRCDVREQCLQYALDNQERFGVWGGYSERERRRLAQGCDVTPNLTPGGNRVPRLTDEQELDLMDLLAQGWTLSRLAAQFGISRSAVGRIRDRRYKQNGAAA